MRSPFRPGKDSRGYAGAQPALPPAMTPHELALVEAYFSRRNIFSASLRVLFAPMREAPPRYRDRG